MISVLQAPQGRAPSAWAETGPAAVCGIYGESQRRCFAEVPEFPIVGLRTTPTILYVQGWRFCLYSNEGAEPMHVHAVREMRSASTGYTRTASTLWKISSIAARRVCGARCAG